MYETESSVTERDAACYNTERDDSDMESTVPKSAWVISDDEERSSDDRKLPGKTGNGPETTGKIPETSEKYKPGRIEATKVKEV